MILASDRQGPPCHEEIITSAVFKRHCITAGSVRFVSGHRFSDDAKHVEEAAFRRWG